MSVFMRDSGHVTNKTTGKDTISTCNRNPEARVYVTMTSL
jgi:hypothetical protein